MPSFSKAILTNRVLAKAKLHGLNKGDLKGAFEKYQRAEDSSVPGSKNYIKTTRDYEVGVTAKRKDGSSWIIISCWKRKLYK